MSEANISIIGATGYTGIELIKILSHHPNVNIKNIISQSQSGNTISKIFPHLENICDLELTNNIDKAVHESDCIFLAVPHKESQKLVPQMIGKCKIIDFASDFRITNTELYSKYYKHTHECPKYIEKFKYGFPEAYANEIHEAQNIANPGCFAITTELALFPLKDFIQKVQTYAITGSTGSGKSPSEGTHHPIRNHNVKSYKAGVHQHIPEIIETLNIKEDDLTMIPTSGPFSRGIHLTAFIQTKETIEIERAQKIYTEKYINCPFVRIKEEVQLAEVVGSNYCDISIKAINGHIVVQCCIDNLLKGASGTAVQNMNLMFGFDEKEGLKNLIPLFP